MLDAALALLPDDDAVLARWFFLALAFGAVGYGIWSFLKREPPRSRPSLFPMERR